MTNVALNNNCPSPSNPQSFDGARFHPLNKAYGTQDNSYASKFLGGSSDLGTWWEQANEYYTDVKNGKAEKPSEPEWQEFLNQMNWADQTLHPYGGNPDAAYMDDEGNYGDYGNQGPVINEFGGKEGPNKGSFNYDMVSTHIGFTGDNTRNDIFGTDNSIDLDTPSAQVTTEITQDHGVSVLKVIVKTSDGTAVYYYDDYTNPDFKLDINIPNINKVTGLTGLPAELQAKIHAKKFDPNAKPEEQVPESSVPGKPVDGQPNTYYYEGTAGQVIDFTPVGSGPNGVTKIFDIDSDANISLKNGDHVNVTLAPAGSDYDFDMTITHKDGSKHVIHMNKPFKTNLNATKEFVTFDLNNDGVADGEAGKVPTELKDYLTLNSTGEAEEGAPLTEGDTAPDSVENGTANYTKSPDVDVHANYDDDVHMHNISAPGTVVIHGADYSDTMAVDYDETTHTWTIAVFKGGDMSQMETFIVKGGPNTKVVLDVMGVTSLTPDSETENVQIGLNGATGATNDEAATRGEALPSREQILANLPTYIQGRVDVQEFIVLFDAAVKSGLPEDWKKVKDKMSHMDGDYVNDLVRSLITSFSNIVGGDFLKLQEMLKLIPADVRTHMRNQLGRADEGWDETDGDWDEKHEGEIWDSQGTEDVIDATLN